VETITVTPPPRVRLNAGLSPTACDGYKDLKSYKAFVNHIIFHKKLSMPKSRIYIVLRFFLEKTTTLNSYNYQRISYNYVVISKSQFTMKIINKVRKVILTQYKNIV